jgi:SAM-dependent methyltransferase
LLAAEYDRAEHLTTRILEMLCRRALHAACRQAGLTRSPQDNVERILEVGSGTGALTEALRDAWPSAEILATDPSVNMLAVLERKLGDVSGLLTTAVAEATGVGEVCRFAPDLIAAGLADPYLDTEAANALRELGSTDTRLFVAVPSHRWARRERTERLGIAIDTTRFRLRGGRPVYTRSLTYDEDGLEALLVASGFALEARGTERSKAIWSQPEVSWVLATMQDA